MQRLKLSFRGLKARATAPAPRSGGLKVFKFGSSVLRTPADLPRVAGEIYRQTLRGERVVAVVSALEGETDELLEACSTAAGQTDCGGIAELVSLGEEKSAALLKIACDRIGLHAAVARPEEFGIETTGPLLEATPKALKGAIEPLFAGGQVLIVPGFVGVDETGCRSLLGRGGTDFSAIFIGSELGAGLIRLYKDVDGVFDHDPAKDDSPLLRFDDISFEECLTLARPLLQPRAVEYASARGLPLEVGTIGSLKPTRVGPATAQPKPHRRPAPLRIALAGYGTAGQALAERLALEEHFELTSILVRDLDKERRVRPPVALTAKAGAFSAPDADILVDLTSCEQTGLLLSRKSLEEGRPVITANKLVAGKHLALLERLAFEQGTTFLYSASVGGGTPALETVRLAAVHGDIVRIDAILNGTVNFLLDQIALGSPYALALQRAQSAGFAEEDPGQDLAGRDAELKLKIIAAQVIGPERLVPISVQSLDGILLHDIAASGERWIQHSSLVFERSGVRGAVRIRPASEVASLRAPAGERNTIRVTCRDGRTWSAAGRGAGGAATAEAVMADLYRLRNGQGSGRSRRWSRSAESALLKVPA